MPQNNVLMEGAKRFYQKIEDTVNKVPTAKKKANTSWHDETVKKANDSFAKKQTSKSTGKRKVGGAAKEQTVAKKRVAPKSGARKLMAKR